MASMKILRPKRPTMKLQLQEFVDVAIEGKFVVTKKGPKCIFSCIVGSDYQSMKNAFLSGEKHFPLCIYLQRIVAKEK